MEMEMEMEWDGTLCVFFGMYCKTISVKSRKKEKRKESYLE